MYSVMVARYKNMNAVTPLRCRFIQREQKCSMWRVFVIVWIQTSVRRKQKVCSCKRNITFIISCQFQTGLRILKTLFDFYVFFKIFIQEEFSSKAFCI